MYRKYKRRGDTCDTGSKVSRNGFYCTDTQHLLLLQDVSNTTVTSVESPVFRYDMTNG